MKTSLLVFTCIMLAGCGTSADQPAESAAADSTAAPLAVQAESQSSDPYIRLYNQGYNFYATGNEPFWNLAIDFDGTMNFSRMGMDDIHIPVGEPIRAQDANVVMYRGQTDGMNFQVTISQNLCNDTMSDIQKPFTVSIRFSENGEEPFTELNGCGNYLADPRLHNIWAVIQINGTALDAANFERGLPRLELFTREGRLAGFDGCNSMMGWFYVKESDVYFGPLAATMMMCPDMETADFLGKTLGSSKLAYAFEGANLVLSKGENTVVLRPVD